MTRQIKNRPGYSRRRRRDRRGHLVFRWMRDRTPTSDSIRGPVAGRPADPESPGHLPRPVPPSSMQRTALLQSGIPAQDVESEITRLHKVATTAAVDTAFALAAERSRAEAEAAQTLEEREEAERWIARWTLASAEDVHPDDLAELQADLVHQIQWAAAEVDGLYLPEEYVDREFIADYMRHGRHVALSRAHHPAAYDWVDPEERRQELLKLAWSYSPIEPYVDEHGDIRLFHTASEQRDAERERDTPVTQPVAGEVTPEPQGRRRPTVRARFRRRA